jgi:uncharacterized protein
LSPYIQTSHLTYRDRLIGVFKVVSLCLGIFAGSLGPVALASENAISGEKAPEQGSENKPKNEPPDAPVKNSTQRPRRPVHKVPLKAERHQPAKLFVAPNSSPGPSEDDTAATGIIHGASSDSVSNKGKDEKLPTAMIKLGARTIRVEIAQTDSHRAKGLMFREKLPDGTGMLFIFEQDQPLGFWMKNTLIPLSIGYFDANQALINVREMVPEVMGQSQLKTYTSSKPARYALEMPAGWYAKYHIQPGSKFSFISRP